MELRGRVTRSIEDLQRGVPLEWYRAAVLEILRTLDQAQLHMMANGEWPELWLERVRFGMVRLLALFMSNTADGDPSAGPSSEQRAEWAGSTLVRCGTLTVISLLADYAATGLAALRKTAPNQYTMNILHSDAGVEALERADMNWWRNHIAASQHSEEMQISGREEEIRKRIALAIQARMSIDEEDDENEDDAEVDEYFESLAVLQAERMVGYDYFPDHVLLGGVEFLNYKRAVVALVRWALYECNRVDVYLELLSTPIDSVQAREIVTPTINRKHVVDLFSEALNIDDVRASRITEMFTMDEAFATTRYSAIPSVAVPPLVSIGADHIAVSLHGCLNAPFQFLLARLRAAYPEDWRSAANQNEAVFRGELYDLFPGDRFLCVSREIKLYHEKRELTDIDAFILDRETGAVGIFQLKWWFTFGAGMRERSSGAKNLAEEAAEWIQRVQWWISHYGLDALANVAGLRRSDRKRLQRPRLFVVGRNFVHFSGQAPAEDAVARGTWYQILRLTVEDFASDISVDTLWEALRRDSPHRRIRPGAPRTIISAGDFEVVIEGYEGG
jgi:hypothetical protein